MVKGRAMNRLVNKLLGRHINGWQLAGFVLANLLGMAIVLVALQFFCDVKPMLTGSDSFLRPGQVVITKRVQSLGTLTGASPSFSEQEIQELERQPFAKAVGRYTPSLFGVFAAVGSGSRQFSTEMFFEAVPDDYLDIDLSQWHYDPESNHVPIILPRTYLNLYNFGFASSQGLPTLSENIISRVNIRLRLTGTRDAVTRTGRVVAFSRTLNTILVPQAFMDDMNQRLSPDRQPQTARLIVRTDNPADERIAAYLEAHNYDTEANDADASRAASFLRLLTTAVMAIGLVITILSFYVLLLSIFLLLQKHTEKIDNLLLIGYSPSMVARPFYLLTIVLNLVVLIAALFIVVVARSWYLPLFGELYRQFEPSAFIPTLLTGTAIFLLVTIINYLAIRRKVHQIWHMHEN